MATTNFTTNLALALPTTGDLTGTWGTAVNTGISELVDQALGFQAFTATGGSDTLTIPDAATGVARSIYIQLNGTGGGTVNVPTTKTKMYFVFNNTASAITFKVTGQTGVSIPAAGKMALVSNGTDIIVAQNYFSALTLGAALPVASGGTSLTTLTANNVILGNGTSTPLFVAPSTSGNVLTSNGTTWSSSAPAAGGITYTAVKVANYTAVNNDGVLTNTTGGAFTVTLPTSPSVGNIVIVVDSFSQWGTNNLTVDPTALIKIAGNTAGDTLVCDITGATVTLVYTGASYGWNVSAQVGGNGGTAVTLTGTQTLTNKTLTAPVLTSPNITTALTLTSASGTSGDVLTSAGSGNAPTWTTPSSGLSAATQAQMETATSNTVAATPSNTQFHPGVAKVWLKAANDGTAINASHNVTSITDDGTGSITVTIATDFSSANYAITTFGAGANSNLAQLNYVTAQAAGSFSADCINPNFTNKDPQTAWFFACFGDQ